MAQVDGNARSIRKQPKVEVEQAVPVKQPSSIVGSTEFKEKLLDSIKRRNDQEFHDLLAGASNSDLELEFKPSSRDVKAPGSRTALHATVKYGDDELELPKQLIAAATKLNSRDYYVNLRDENGLTALHIAADLNAAYTIEYLLDNGADPNLTAMVKPGHERTAWELCAESLSDGAFPHHDAVAAFSAKELQAMEKVEQFRGLTESPVELFGVKVTSSNPYQPHYTSDRPRRWFYLRGNNRFWLYGVVRRISETSVAETDALPRIYRYIDDQFLERCESVPRLRFREPSCSFDIVPPHPDDPPEERSCFISLVMPFIFSDSSKNVSVRKGLYEQVFQKSKHCCSGSGRVSEKIFGVHLPLTLDEYCKPALGEDLLNGLNKDQVLVRKEKSKFTEEELDLLEGKVPESANLIVIQQAWVWKFYHQIITAYPEPCHGVTPNFWRWSGNPQNSDSVESDYTAIGLFLSDIVNTFDRPLFAGLSEHPFNTFEKAITILSEEVNKYLDSPTVDAMHIEDEKKFLHEITDIREELSMIRSVLDEQEEVWREFASNAWPKYWVDGRLINHDDQTWEWSMVTRPQTQLPKYKRRLDKIDRDAERVENSISARLDLKAKYASISEAHSTAIMSAAVFGFTLITIIFTPLSFILALFALPIDQFRQHQDKAGVYSTNYIGKYAATTEVVSIIITALAMWAVVEYGLRLPVRHRIGQAIKSWFKRHNVKEAKSANTAEAHTGVGDVKASYSMKSDMDKPNVEKGKSKHKWFRKSGNSKLDVEKATENSNHGSTNEDKAS